MASELLPRDIWRRSLKIPTFDEAREILGGKLPTVFEKYDFPEKGIVLTEQGPKVPVYVASQLGFNFPGWHFLNTYLHPSLEERGALILDPFEMCGEYIDGSFFDEDNQSFAVLRNKWDRFSRVVVDTVNYGLAIPEAEFLFAVCEGATLDDGMSAEIPYMATNFGSIVAVRSDVRGGENIGSRGVNPAVSAFTENRYQSSYIQRPMSPQNRDEAYQEAFVVASRIIGQRLDRYQKDRRA